MHDHHSHQHNHTHDADVKNISVAFFLNLSFTIIEIIGGLLTNSMAILSDAIHDLGDSFSLGMAWYFQKFSKKKSDKHYSYGYKRFALLGAIINSIILLVGSIFIISEAIPRILNPEPTHTVGMFFLAILGVGVNGAAMFRLRRGNSLNEKVVSLHMLEDVLGWLAILIGSVVMHFFDMPVLDPVLSVAIALFVIFNVFKNLKQSLKIVLQAIPQEIDSEKITEELVAFDEIKSVHDLHIWSVDGEYNVMTLHVVLTGSLNAVQQTALKQKIREHLLHEGIQHATIEFENETEKCDFEECC
ncbi:MAG: cation transporter [Paludibacter sp.]|nr:cation transporter [Paludibacter sp.]MBP6663376.1 cation transporter [Paludibacter sp.]